MYTIKQASTLTGVGTPLIRAWERRYGVVKPVRTASGYRLYDDAAIQVLLTMRGLVASGWMASEAARAIAAGEVPVGGARVAQPEAPAMAPPEAPAARPAGAPAVAAPDAPAMAGPGAPAVVPAVGAAVAARRDGFVARFLAAATASSPRETEAALDDILAGGSFEAVVDDLLLPAVTALGDAWAAGTLSVAAEHAASAAVARRLAVAFEAAGVPGRPSAVVGLPPGSRHELGALAFAVALRRRGIGVLYLGQDVTVEGWLDVVTRTRARAVVVGVVTPADRAGAASVVERMLERQVPVVAVGGAAANADLDPEGRLLVLPPRVTDAARVVATAIGRRT